MDTGEQRELREAIEALSRRLARLEEKLGVDAEEGVGAPRGPVEPATPPTEPVSPGERSEKAAPKPDTGIPLDKLIRARDAARAQAKEAAPPDTPAPPTTSASPPTSPTPPPAKPTSSPPPARTLAPIKPGNLGERARPAKPANPSKSPTGLEQLIGLRAFGVVGALVVIAGAALFLKLAWDQGWLRLSDLAKCNAGAGFGVLLLLAGEFTRRKLGSLASVGFSAAGLGVLYATAYASFALYELVTRPVAFALLVLVAGVGIGVSAVARLASVGLVSIVGGYMVPFLLASGEPPPPALLPTYWSALLVVGLVLSALLGGRFFLVRMLVWWGSFVLGGAWVVAEGVGHHTALALGFIAVVWGAVHAELYVAAHRKGLAGERVGRGLLVTRGVRVPWRVARALGSSLSLTAWAVVLGVLVVQASGVGHLDWMVGGALFVATAMGALVLAGGLSVVRDVPSDDPSRLGALLAAQAGALLIVALVLALPTWVEPVAGAALGVGAALAGRWVRARGLEVYAVVVLGLVAARLALVDWWLTGSASIGGESVGIFWNRWMLLAAVGGVAWIVSARLMLIGAGRARAIATVSASVGFGLVFLAFVHVQSAAHSIGGAWLILAGGIAAARPLERRLPLGWVATSGLALASFAWLLGFVTGMDSGEGVHRVGLVWSVDMLLGVLVACGWIGAARFNAARGGTRTREYAVVGLSLGLVILFASFVHVDAEATSVVGAWIALTALVGAACPFERRLPVPGMALAGLVATTSAWAVAFVWGLEGEGGVAALGLVWGRIMVLGAIVAAAWIGAGRLGVASKRAYAREAGVIGASLGVAIVYLLFLHTRAQASSVMVVWLVLSAVLAVVRRVEPRFYLERAALAGLLATTGAWGVAFLGGWQGEPAWVHPGLVGALVIAAVGAAVCRTTARRADAPPNSREVVLMGAIGALLLVFLATTLEAARLAPRLTSDQTAQRAAISIWWGLFSAPLLAVGFRRKLPPVRYAALALLAIATAKAVVWDLQGVAPAWRVASFLGLGLLMLLVAFAYARATIVRPRAEPDSAGPFDENVDDARDERGGDTPGEMRDDDETP